MEILGLVAIALLLVWGVVLLLRPQTGARASNAPSSRWRSPQTSLAEIEDELRQLLLQGQTIAAIRRVRKVTNFSLAEAKAYVAALAAGSPPPSHPHPSPTVNLDPEQVAAIQALIDQGQQIAAIKCLRDYTGMSLAAAKAYVEGHHSGNP